MLPVNNLPAASALDSPFQSESAAPGGTLSLRIKRRPARAPARMRGGIYRGWPVVTDSEGRGRSDAETASSESGWNDRLRVAASWITLRFGEPL